MAQPEVLARQDALQLNVPDAVAVIGCGGVGSWIAYFLALAGVQTIYLWDFDTVSENNLNRLFLPKESVGKPKSSALAAEIARIRPGCRAIAMGNFSMETAALMGPVQWVAVSTDTLKSRRLVFKWCRTEQYPRPKYVEASAEGEAGGVAGSPAEWSTEDEELPGYASVPVWVGPCVFAATMAVSHILHNTIPEYIYRIAWTRELEFLKREE